jgi:hypothetical protein
MYTNYTNYTKYKFGLSNLYNPCRPSMALTRNQLRQSQQSYPRLNTNTSNTNGKHNIDFIDASIEWRKNKVKKENCTFEYITPHQ